MLDTLGFHDEGKEKGLKGVDIMHNRAWDVLYREKLSKKLIRKSEVTQKMQVLEAAYESVKARFQGTIRDSGIRYFEHQRQSTYLMLTHSQKPSFLKTLILLEHDTIEDTNKTYDGLEEDYWEKVALGILLITKKPFCDFINNPEDQKIFDGIKKAKILNKKGLLSDQFKHRIKHRPKTVTQDEENALEDFKSLKKTYKKVKNADFFQHMRDFNSFVAYARELREQYSINLTDEELKEVCLESLESKFWDRLHNLCTSDACTVDKIERKIEETRKYFQNIGKELFPYIWKMIEKELAKLEKKLKKHYSFKAQGIINQTGDDLTKIMNESQDKN